MIIPPVRTPTVASASVFRRDHNVAEISGCDSSFLCFTLGGSELPCFHVIQVDASGPRIGGFNSGSSPTLQEFPGLLLRNLN